MLTPGTISSCVHTVGQTRFVINPSGLWPPTRTFLAGTKCWNNLWTLQLSSPWTNSYRFQQRSAPHSLFDASRHTGSTILSLLAATRRYITLIGYHLWTTYGGGRCRQRQHSTVRSGMWGHCARALSSLTWLCELNLYICVNNVEQWNSGFGARWSFDICCDSMEVHLQQWIWLR